MPKMDFMVSDMVPHADEYVGAWAIRESNFNALVTQAQNINIQLHMQQIRDGKQADSLAAQASTDYEVDRNGIAVIELRGSLTKHGSSFSRGRSMVAARRAVRAAVADDDVASILLKIDSPGGTVSGTVDLAEEVFGLPARLGKPRKIESLTDITDAPRYATAVGLVQYGLKQQDSEMRGLRPSRKRRKTLSINGNRIENIKRWFADIF